MARKRQIKLENMEPEVEVPEKRHMQVANVSVDMDKGKFKCMADSIAEDNFCHINYMVPQLKEKFSEQYAMWNVSRMYPYSKYGKLVIDELEAAELKKEETWIAMQAKKKIIEGLGFKYLILTPNMKKLDAVEALA